MLAELVPGAVRVAEAFNDDVLAQLFPAEEEAVRRAVPKRRREFAAVRACARRALGELGVAPVALVPGARRAPSWPAGVVGSMTHCDGYRGCAVARASDFVAIGIDAEPAEPLPTEVLSVISLERERRQLTDLAHRTPSVCWDRLLFSIKEAVYKAWFPVAGAWLGFDDAAVDIDPDGTFSVELLVSAPAVDVLGALRGRWGSRDGLVICALACPVH